MLVNLVKARKSAPPSAAPRAPAPLAGLLLTGGGARNAYQVGVLRAIAEQLPRGQSCPFKVISGTSAGAINACGLAAQADNFQRAVRDLGRVWGHLAIEQVYRTDAVASIRSAAATVWMAMRAREPRHQPRSLLDNGPLRELLSRHIHFARIEQHIDDGYLRGLAINTSSYTSGKSVSYFMAEDDVPSWEKPRRKGVRDTITIDHLLASAAIPVVFPAVRIRNDFQGDGALRQASPLSPLLAMGANRILAISVGNPQTESDQPNTARRPYPSLGQVSGYLLESLFLEALDADLERLSHYNTLLRKLPGRHVQLDGSVIQPVEHLVLTPSQDVREIVSRHMHRFPRSMNVVLRVLGAHKPEGRQISSYLLFEAPFCRELMDLGYSDARARMGEIDRLLFPQTPATEADATS